MEQHRPTHTQLIITLIGLVLIAGAIWYVNKGQRVTNPAPVSTDTTSQWPSKEITKQTISEENQYYTISAAYPQTGSDRITRELQAFVEDQIAQFKSDTAWVTDPSLDSAAAGSLSLSVDYREVVSSYADTYVFTVSTYTGGAHGLQVTRTFAYDKLGTPIALNTLFANPDTGLAKVAAFVQGELTKKDISDPQWIKDGAAATAENYQSFIISDEGVTFVFDPYQVAPYAAGTQNILVPFAVFKPLANPELFGK
jgi:hypothetical protein